MQNSKKFMFVHIPRTAGTSIIRTLDLGPPLRHPKIFGTCVRYPIYFGHDPIFYLSNHNNLEEYLKFTIVRNPYTRVYSNYKAFLAQIKIGRIENIIKPISFKEFLLYIRTKGSSTYSNIIFPRAPFCIFDQCFYLENDSGEFAVDKIYRFENIKEFEQDFNIELPNVNPSDTKTEDYLSAYDKETIGLVKSLFYKDFCLLNYSFNFEESI